MFHLRIISPPDLTASVFRALGEDPGVTHITAERGGATEPVGGMGGLLTLALTRTWARRIQTGRALVRPKSTPG